MIKKYRMKKKKERKLSYRIRCLICYFLAKVWHQNYLHDRQVKDLTTAIYFWKKFFFFANQIVCSDIDLGVTIDKYFFLFFLLEQVRQSNK
ncbi:hypothetical protein B1F79_03280 [Coxiella-like endosymbiont of Rhipicephalus sanguineus]|nr:hypothetical protein [Coxiella-like endosymbiont of Rhipicephalus sanguineus]